MSAALDTTAAIGRAQAAFANAGAAMASLAQTVVDAHREIDRQADAKIKDAERREREARRMADDLERRLADVERREELLRSEQAVSAELKKSYRRGYETGYARGKTGKPAAVERALDDPRNNLAAVA